MKGIGNINELLLLFCATILGLNDVRGSEFPTMSGCYSAPDHTVFGTNPSTAVQNTAQCIQYCSNKNLAYAAVMPYETQYNRHYSQMSCFCGEALPSTRAECNIPCQVPFGTESTELCGGFNTGTGEINAAYVHSTTDCQYQGVVSVTQAEPAQADVSDSSAFLTCSFDISGHGNQAVTHILWRLDDVRNKPVIYSYDVSAGQGIIHVVPGYENVVRQASDSVNLFQGQSYLLVFVNLNDIHKFRCEVYQQNGAGCSDSKQLEVTDPVMNILIGDTPIFVPGQEMCDVTSLTNWDHTIANLSCSVAGAAGTPNMEMIVDGTYISYDDWVFNNTGVMFFAMKTKHMILVEANSTFECTVTDRRGTFTRTCKMPESPPTPNPGFRSRITQKALDYARDVTTRFVVMAASAITIPDITKDVAGYTISLTDFVISDFPEPVTALTLTPNIGIRWVVTVNPTINANYNAKWWGSEETGTLHVVASDLTLDMEFFVGRTAEGAPDIHVYKCDPTGELAMTFVGGWSSSLNTGVYLAGGSIKKMMFDQACDKIRTEVRAKAIEALEKAGMTDMTHTLRDRPMYQLDYGWVKYPVVYSDAMEADYQGEMLFLNQGVPVSTPFPAPELPVFTNHDDHMVYIYISDHVVNSAFYAAFAAGRLARNITSAKLPPNVRGYLSTDCTEVLCLSSLYPELKTAFPRGKGSVDIRATHPPVVQFIGGKIVVEGGCDIDIHIKARRVKTTILTIHANVSATFAAQLHNGKLSYSLEAITPMARVLYISPSIGNQRGSEYIFNTMLRVAVNTFLVPKLTEIGNTGLQLPTFDEVRFENPTVVIDPDIPHMLMIASDIYYNGDLKDIDISDIERHVAAAKELAASTSQ